MGKIISYLKCLLPTIFYEIGIFVALFLAMSFSVIIFGAEGVKRFGSNSVILMLFVDLFCLTLIGFWYWRTVRKRVWPQNPISILYIDDVLLFVCLSFGTQLLVEVFISIEGMFIPLEIEKYANLIETSGITDNSIVVFISTVIIGPILEEIIFRGLTIYYCKKAKMNFWITNTIQALLFGIVHHNLIQGSYAFLLGLILGYVYDKYETLYAPILLHMFFNGMPGIIVELVPESKSAFYFIFSIIGIFVLIYCLKEIHFRYEDIMDEEEL